jgi:hypothetical protein
MYGYLSNYCDPVLEKITIIVSHTRRKLTILRIP